MHAAVDEPVDGFVGNLLDTAAHEALVLRAFAAQSPNGDVRRARRRQAALIEELIRYARDRDRALAQRVTECARLRVELETTPCR